MLRFEKAGGETWLGWARLGLYTVQRSNAGDRKFVAVYQPRMAGRQTLSNEQIHLGRFDDSRHAITAAHAHYDAIRKR